MVGALSSCRPPDLCLWLLQVAEEEEDSGAPPLKRFCADQNSVCHAASES